jgi:hypothetical protein
MNLKLTIHLGSIHLGKIRPKSEGRIVIIKLGMIPFVLEPNTFVAALRTRLDWLNE